jgi:hypothetical protein
VTCGTGYAKDQSTCDDIMYKQVLAATNLTLDVGILAFGASNPAVTSARYAIETKLKQARKVTDAINNLKSASDKLSAFNIKVNNLFTGTFIGIATTLGNSLSNTFQNLANPSRNAASSFNSIANDFANNNLSTINQGVDNVLTSIGVEIYSPPSGLTAQETVMWNVRNAFDKAKTICVIANTVNPLIAENTSFQTMCDSFSVISAFTYTAYNP